MKTSLVIEDSLFREAEKVAQKEKKTLSEVISHWARLGRELLRHQKGVRGKKLRSLDLGGPASVDVNSRREWMDLLDS